MIDIAGAWDIVAVLGAVILATVWLKSQLVKQRHQELEQLADTRGERIDDLEKRVEEQAAKVAALEAKIGALVDLKADDIANRVVDRLRETGLVG